MPPKLSKQEFWDKYYGLPSRKLGAIDIFVIGLIFIVIVAIIVLVLFLLNKTVTMTQKHTGLYNLDVLKDLNTLDVTCCVAAGSGTPNETYVFHSVTGITYSRDVPTNINTVCNTFPDPPSCVAENTDSSGNIIPVATFKAQPYYTFENGLFIGCSSTTTCS